MANIFRGPIYVGRREVPPTHWITAFAVPSLLATTLATAGTIPLPLGAAHLPPAQIYPQRHLLVQNADTSQGTPKALLADAQAPFFVRPHIGPQQPAFLPFDTSLGQSVLLKVAVVLPPFIPPPHYAPVRYLALSPDGSLGAPKTLFADKQLPFANLQHTPPDSIRPVWDTSQQSYGTTKPVVIAALPPGTALAFSAPGYAWSVTDVSRQSRAVLDIPVSPILTPDQLAQLYGGGFMHEKGKKKKKPPVEDLAVMVKTIAEDDPGGKQKLIALLPPKDRPEPTDEAWEATTMSLIMQIRESTQRVQKGVEKLYYEHRQRDDDEAFVLFNF